MFFNHLVRSIKPESYVLEIGPGSTPHPQSDIYLELKTSAKEAKSQRGNLAKIKYSKPVIYYGGGKFPFKDKEFDYVICSHVLEHVPDLRQFLNEVFRISPKGYFEYPTIIYEYLYNFRVHLNLLWYSRGCLYFLKKDSTSLTDFQPVQDVLLKSLVRGHDEIVTSLTNIMFQGFEWRRKFKTREVKTIKALTPKVKIEAKANH